MRSSQKGKRFKLFPLILYVLFGALSSLTIAESAVPSGASGNQSWSLAKLMNDFLTAILPPKELITANPSKLDILPSAPSAKFGEETKRIFADDEAIIGTTKMYTYTLTYDTSTADIYNSNIDFKPLITPGENSYTLTMITFFPEAWAFRMVSQVPLEVAATKASTTSEFLTISVFRWRGAPRP